MDVCKICGSSNLTYLAHTAKCRDCGVLLCWPYPLIREATYLDLNDNFDASEKQSLQNIWLNWHINSGNRNHHNFQNMAQFALNDNQRHRKLQILDYGGGGGQFSLVLKSLYPLADSFIVDMQDNILLDVYRPMNQQIKFADFELDARKFDVIFMNDVFEHVSDPIGLLRVLRIKLKEDGYIFIDTPCQFWLYSFTKIISRNIHIKVLRGTVDYDHQQIWSKKSFETALNKSGFKITKYKQLSEYTQGASFYLDNMGIKNIFIRALGYLFVMLSPVIAKNKIMCLATKLG